jgi:cysteine desulfurase / selenocysteine lyase
VSHVQFATGYRFDIKALVELARAHDATLVLDATQSAGAVPLDGDVSEVDFVVSGSYKWLCGPFGSALCYLGPRVRESFDPPLVCWRNVIDPYRLDARTMRLPADARRLEFSTSGYGAAVALGYSIDYVLEHGVDRILEHNLALTERLITGLDRLDATVLTPRQLASAPESFLLAFLGETVKRLLQSSTRVALLFRLASDRRGCQSTSSMTRRTSIGPSTRLGRFWRSDVRCVSLRS